MSEQQALRWKRLFAEGVAIVLSILLAFAIDAWWEDRNDQQAAQVLLHRLKADFTEIRTALRLTEADHRETSAACIALMNIPLGQPVPATPEFDRKVALVFLTSRTLTCWIATSCNRSPCVTSAPLFSR